MNVFDVFKERGFLEQCTGEDRVRTLLSKPVTCYIGFDPTSDSFHCGSLVPIMALAHLQRHGHRVIPLMGGGTSMIGDPSGKTELRQLITVEQIDSNSVGLKKQFAKFIDFSEDRAIMLDNAEWLRPLNYIEFLRDIGKHFSVNKMLSAESYRMRLETGLNFIEFNYMLLQAYDFLHLYQNYDCVLQMGGNDQWGNILAGTDLIRRVTGGDAEALTFPLLATASGAKMGKTEKGAIWLDGEKTPPYDYYQYWINTDDRDVRKFLALFTFLPMEEVDRLASREGADLREAKEVLAWEATRMVHGDEEADKARDAAKALFCGEAKASSERGARIVGKMPDSIPRFSVDEKRLKEGIPAFILLADSGIVKSRGEARRLVQQGGAYVNGRRIEEFDEKISFDDLVGGCMLLRAGKKKYIRIDPV